MPTTITPYSEETPRARGEDTYAAAHDATEFNFTTDAYGQAKGLFGEAYIVVRGVCAFNPNLPVNKVTTQAASNIGIDHAKGNGVVTTDVIVSAASFYFKLLGKLDSNFDLVIQSLSADHPFTSVVYNKANFSGNGGSLHTSEMSPGWVEIPLNETGISWILTGSGVLTKLGIRSSEDIDNVAPADDEVLIWTSDSGYPYLSITYAPVGSITKRGFEVRLAFAGTLYEAISHSIAGFEGDFSYNISTGKWEGTLVKTITETGSLDVGAFTGDLGRFPIAVASNKLFAAETYDYRAYAIIDGDTYYGDYIEFTTNSYPSGEGPDNVVSPAVPIVEPLPPIEEELIPFWEWPEIVFPPWEWLELIISSWEWPDFDIPPFEFDVDITFGRIFGAFLRRLDTKKDWKTLREKCIIYQENMNQFTLTINHNTLVLKNLVNDIITYINGDVYPSDLKLMNSSQHLTPLYLEGISPDGFKDIINDFRLKDVHNVYDLNRNFKKMLNSLNSLYESDYSIEPISYNTREYIDIQPTAKRMILQLEDMRKKSKEVQRLVIKNIRRIFTYV